MVLPDGSVTRHACGDGWAHVEFDGTPLLTALVTTPSIPAAKGFYADASVALPISDASARGKATARIFRIPNLR